MAEPTKVIMVRERVWESWAKDVISAACLIAMMWFNANYCGGSAWIYAVIAVVWFLWLLGKASKNLVKLTPAEARAWLDKHFPEEAA
jgi:hypothetical protein